LHATFLALTNEQLAWPQKEDEFARLRDEANRLLIQGSRRVVELLGKSAAMYKNSVTSTGRMRIA
jgi:hypothetical protein